MSVSPLTCGLRTSNDLGPAWPTIVHRSGRRVQGPAGKKGERESGQHGTPQFPLDCFCACINEGDV